MNTGFFLSGRKVFCAFVLLSLLMPMVTWSAEEGEILIFEEREVKKGRVAKKYKPETTLGVTKMNEDALKLVDQRKYDEALALYFAAIDRVKQKSIKDVDFEAELLNNTARAFYEKGFFNSFSFSDNEAFIKAVEYASQSVLVKESYWPAYVTLADVFYKLKDYEKVDQFFTKAEEYVEKDSRDYEKIVKKHNLVKKILEKQKKEEDEPAVAE
ncbi:MAG: hypothetical protein AMQ74_00885 [Candidatus Methanofastidiosum methylothiophilum]|uniref:Tetratricopeptide repeat protein n=1 Tax=Candidatus Methanofastidiosum methylothiophilum TaxID=1705564 RepID=A0A150J4B8_9EURY|nr:MAG: hypothetical protein AMQ74_00885 [Candidatus Methanofastidiosum methylthiophilus]